MTSYQIMYWHDIPLQIRAGSRRDRVSRELPQRFQDAVDRAAMAASLTGTDDYLSEFFWAEPLERDGTPAEVVDAIIAELDDRYREIDWRRTAESIKAKRG